MRTLIAAAGVLALSTGAAFAQSAVIQEQGAYGYAPDGETVASYDEVYSPSQGTNYEFHDDGYVTPAPGFSGQNTSEALDSTPNMGAGTSRSSNANSG
ncbi:hypothetical protein ACFOWB_15520 [Chenggangzhangella methanolivorans]|uniref:hypothetical protein n=1 Tax=Chenggangzhangella methanolivorans TaxID=1437009 RepID=UPI003607CDB7